MSMPSVRKITREEAEELLAVSRDVRWPFPSSSGRPVRREAGAGIEALAARR